MGTLSATPIPTASSRAANSRRSNVAVSILLVGVFFGSYWRTLRALVSDWFNDPGYSFGLIIPFVIAYLVFSRRGELQRIPRIPASSVGLTLILLSQIMFLVGSLSAEFFLQRSSIVVLGVGTVLYLAGWGWLTKFILPFSLFQLCIPLPAIILQQISMPLQLVSSWGAANLLRQFGVPVYRAGNILQLPQQILSVTEACSGLRSLASMIALALVLVSMSRLSCWLRAVVIASAVAVAVVSNALRITGTGLLGEHFGRRATLGMWHSLEGWFVFITALIMLLAEVALLQRLFGRQDAKGSA